MKIEAAGRVIAENIQRLLPGCILCGPHKGDRYLREAVSFDTAHKLRIYPPGEKNRFFLLKRPIPFSYDEKELVAALLGSLCGGAHKCAAGSAKKSASQAGVKAENSAL